MEVPLLRPGLLPGDAMKPPRLQQFPTCEETGKIAYSSRKTARQAGHRAFPGKHLSPYRHDDHWHIGHLPQAALLGVKARAEVYR